MDSGKYSVVNPVRVVIVTDGDSFTVELPDWPEYLGRSIGVRISGIDTPEIRTRNMRERAAAIAARSFLQSILQGAKSITLHHIKRDKYFRLLASVEVDGIDLAVRLIQAGHARRYVGGKRQAW